MRQELLSIVLSLLNEEEVLPELINRLESVLEPMDIEYELIFVNDNSNDRSSEVILNNRKRNNRIKIINMSRRFGSPACVTAGFLHSRGDVLIYMDTDLQDPPELIPTLLDKWRDGFDVVHTKRTKRKGENLIKLWLTRRAYSIINFMANIDIIRDAGDFKLLSRRAVDAVLTLGEYDPFFRGLSRWVGFKQTQVFYEREPRFAGKTKYSLWEIGTNPHKELIRGITSFSSVPLYFSLFLGFIVSFCAFGYLIYIIISRIFFGLHIPGWPALMVTMLFLGGTILFTIGILGMYIGNIHQSIKNRPMYIIDNKIGFENNK